MRLRHPHRRTSVLSDTARAALETHRAGLAPAPDEQPLRALPTAFSPRTAAPPAALARHPGALRAAEEYFSRIERHQHTLLDTLPTAHDYLARLHAPPAHRTVPPPGPKVRVGGRTY